MKTLIKISFCVSLFISCGGNNDKLIEEIIPDSQAELGSFDLLFPDNNLICTEGTDAENDQVSITFRWSASENATSYDIEITNQETGSNTKETVTTIEKAIIVPKGKQFTWNVTAKVEDETKRSSQWNFYSEGTAQENFAPFPAEIAITDNQNGTVNITWEATDLDNDITAYDIYLGTEVDPTLFLENVTTTSITDYNITPNTPYNISVVTKDSRDNTSTSKLSFEF